MKEVIDAKKEDNLLDVITLSTGYRARLKPVSSRLLQSVMSRFPEPDAPIVYDENKGRKIVDELDPAYLAEMRAVSQKKAEASLDAMAMFGIELIDPIPEDGEWLEQLKLFASIGYLDLEQYDLEDSVTKEFLFKRFIALGNADLVAISGLSGIRKKDIQAAEEIFRGNAGGDSD